MKSIRLGLRLLLRDWRSGHLSLLLTALFVAVTTHNTIGFHSERIENAMTMQASNLMGGDLVVKSPTPLHELPAFPDSVQGARAIEFSSVVMAADAMQLASLKAVSNHYPLKASLKVADQPFAPDYETRTGPGPGKAWVEARLLNIL
ncbi:MAG TPA: ABC transporter permease, partial [Gammaproteobacteria bacterium]|nr:ABC transporter permease [Gammaproteobacteria bacterium]